MSPPPYPESDSDTESQTSERDAIQPLETLASADPIASLSEVTTNLRSAISTLDTLDLSQVEQDEATQKHMHQANHYINDSLAYVMTHIEDLSAESDSEHFFDIIFCSLFQIGFFTRLLDIRDALHCIASRQLYSSKVSVVCWVDVVLTKMGNLISVIVTEATETASTLDAPSLAGLKIEQSLQAAIQMPSTWDAIPGFIASDYASPAATRLALNLLYAVYILGKIPNAGDDWPSEGPSPAFVLGALNTYILKHGNDLYETKQYTYDDPCIILEDRLSMAMAISLFASAQSALCEANAPCQPFTRAVLLENIKEIMCQSSTLEGVVSLEPPATLDTAQKALICHRSNVLIPWCWMVWNDSRTLDNGIIPVLTSTWLYHLGSDESWREILMKSIAVQPLAAFCAIHTLLSCLQETCNITHRQTCLQLTAPTMDVLRKATWGLRQLICAIQNKEEMESIQDRINCAGHVLLSLFVSLGHSQEDLQVKGEILGALTSISNHPAVLLNVLRQMVEQSKLIKTRLTCTLDELNVKLKKHCTTARLDPVNWQRTRLLLQFMKMIWQVEGPIEDFFHPLSISTLISVTIKCLTRTMNEASCQEPGEDDENHSVTLLSVLLETLATMYSTKQQEIDQSKIRVSWKEDDVWNLAVSANSVDVATVSAFASYVVARGLTPQELLRDESLISMGWDLFRDFVLLKAHGHFDAIGEGPRALTASPIIIRALGTLLSSTSRNIVKAMLGSPWTDNLRETLVQLHSSGETRSAMTNIENNQNVLHCGSVSTLIENLLHEMEVSAVCDNQ